MRKIIVGLINGRHQMPVDKYIFEEIKDVFNFDFIRQEIYKFLETEVGIYRCQSTGINQIDYTDVECFKGRKEVVVYVTGLTVVVAELIAQCARNGVKLTLMHYNNSSNAYEEQRIF